MTETRRVRMRQFDPLQEVKPEDARGARVLYNLLDDIDGRLADDTELVICYRGTGEEEALVPLYTLRPDGMTIYHLGLHDEEQVDEECPPMTAEEVARRSALREAGEKAENADG